MNKSSQTKVKIFTNKKFLLDTHTWIWLINGSSELSKEIIDCINAAGSDGKIYISAISIWEIAMLAAKNKISLKMPIHEWIKEGLSQSGVKIIPLHPEISIESTVLPDNFIGDPADKIVIATARFEQLTILTRDQKILTYAENGYLSARKI